MDTISFVNKKVMELWHKWENELKRIENDLKVPLIYPSMAQEVLLFVGSNPSFVASAYRSVLRDGNYNTTPEDFLSWRNHGKYALEMYQHVERKVRKSYYRFFKVLDEISKEVGLEYEHIDLFFYRKTGQKELKKVVYDDKGKLNEFGCEQLKLSGKLIETVMPKVIVVANAFASHLFKEKYGLKWDNEHGYYIWRPQSGERNVPVFLGSMLSGQRALDIYSRERLIWHIKKAIKETTNE